MIDTSTSTLETITFAPVLIESKYCFSVKGRLYTLDPKEDLTPIEHWRIHELISIMQRSAGYGERVGELLLENAKKKGIERHFTVREI